MSDVYNKKFKKEWNFLGAFILALVVEMVFAFTIWCLNILATDNNYVVLAMIVIAFLMIYVLYLYLQMVIEYINIKNENEKLLYKLALEKAKDEEKKDAGNGDTDKNACAHVAEKAGDLSDSATEQK